MNLTSNEYLLAAACVVLLGGCRAQPARLEPTIEFTRIPPAGDGSPDQLTPVAGHVNGAKPGDRIVLFAQSGVWWVQPTADQPFTAIKQDSTWGSETHPGISYAALLVGSAFHPAPTMKTLPVKGGEVKAIVVAEGPALKRASRQTVQFSGYEWEVRQTASNRSGATNKFVPGNAWTDGDGFLHLRVAKESGQWTSGEVALSRGLGYGTYTFQVRELSHLEPAEVFSIFTWDDAGPAREMDVEISRWGDAQRKNAQYVVQPYYVPANAVRFMAPAGTLVFSIRWEPGRVAFSTRRGKDDVASHVFTSGVPVPGNESIRLNHYIVTSEKYPLRHGSEVIVEKFQYLP